MSAMILLMLGNGCALHPETSKAKSAISCNREEHSQISGQLKTLPLQPTFHSVLDQGGEPEIAPEGLFLDLKDNTVKINMFLWNKPYTD